MKSTNSEKGQALILIAFGIVALIGFTALAVDGGRVFSDRRHAQNAADTSALAAALAEIRNDPTGYEARGLERAASNGYSNDSDSTVTVDFCDAVAGSDPCTDLPAGADPSEYIRVKITSDVPMTFARVLGRPFVTNRVEAITRVQGSLSSPILGGAAMVALRPDGTGFTASGNGQIDVNGSGIFSNSTDPCSMRFNGTADVYVDTDFETAAPGTICSTGGIDLHGPTSSGPQVPYPPTQYNIPPPSITCSGNTTVSGNTLAPGNHPGMNLHDDITLLPGNHCFNGTFKVTGGIITANDVNILITSGAFDINGGSFNCSNMLFYSNGGSGMQFNGNGEANCTGVTFYLGTGGLIWNGNFENHFSAPTSGTYKGLLVYLPYGNTSAVSLNGTADSEFTGSIIGISAPITVHGNSGSDGYHTMIIGYDITVTGNSNTTINFDPDEQYIPPADPTLEFTK
jgi:Flp pilus assembly protein TadG